MNSYLLFLNFHILFSKQSILLLTIKSALSASLNAMNSKKKLLLNSNFKFIFYRHALKTWQVYFVFYLYSFVTIPCIIVITIVTVWLFKLVSISAQTYKDYHNR